jgi:hypothetical protein
MYGAINYHIADWDVGISLIMGVMTYLCAPWSVWVIVFCLERRPPYWWLWIFLSLAVAWLVVDGVYVAYHTLMGNQMYRWANFLASSALYFLAGSVWLYRGSIRDFSKNVRSSFRISGRR